MGALAETHSLDTGGKVAGSSHTGVRKRPTSGLSRSPASSQLATEFRSARDVHIRVVPGTFAHILGHYVRDRQALTLIDALRKMTLLPAKRLEQVSPQMADKGRLRIGADADLTIFDPVRVIDRATYDAPDQ